MKLLKRTMSLTLALSMMFLMGATAWAADTLARQTNKRPLTEFSDAELEVFFEEMGVVIPEEFKDYPEGGLQQTIRDLEEDPYRYMAIGWAVPAFYELSVRLAMDRYYGIENSWAAQMADSLISSAARMRESGREDSFAVRAADQLIKSAAMAQDYERRVSLSVQAASRLVNSTVLGSWVEGMRNYNCYGYALGKTEWCLIGDFS